MAMIDLTSHLYIEIMPGVVLLRRALHGPNNVYHGLE
jgi:hypothetical protein